MKKITFKDIYTPGIAIFENEQYIHVHDSKMLLRYDSNFLEFKKMPSINQFKEAAEYLRAFHETKGQKHVKFYFPENEILSDELTNYLEEKEFIVGFTELYSIQPHCFPSMEENDDIKIEVVTEKNLDAYLYLQYEQDRIFGDDFADQKIEMNKSNFKEKNIVQLLAIYLGIPAGAVDVILTEEKAIAEIDGIFVMDEYQKKRNSLTAAELCNEEICR